MSEPNAQDQFGRRLLASAGIIVSVVGSALLLVSTYRSAGLLAAGPGVVVIGIGVLLVVLAAFYNTVSGVVRYLQSEVHFGTPFRGRDDDDWA